MSGVFKLIHWEKNLGETVKEKALLKESDQTYKIKLTNSNKVEDEKGYNYWHQINSQVLCLICQSIQVKCPANKKKGVCIKQNWCL